MNRDNSDEPRTGSSRSVDPTLDIAALISHPIQYQAPLFRELSDRDEVDLQVYFCDRRGLEATKDPGFGTEISWDIDLLKGYDYEFLNNYSPVSDKDSFLGLLNPGLVSSLRNRDHDVLWIHGYMSATNWLGLALSSLLDLKVVFRGESTLSGSKPWYKRGMKRFVLETLFRTVDTFAAIGSRNREFYQAYGIPEERIFDAPYTVDNEFWQEQGNHLPDAPALRKQHEISKNPTVFLFVGKLIERKQPKMLLRAFCRTTEPGEANLLFVGDGALRDELEGEVSRRKRGDDVHFVGFQNQSKLPQFYKLSDVFVLPSEQENWGLVVNEAMNFGLPVIATAAVGSTADLVDERNGVVIEESDKGAIATAIRRCLKNPDSLERMGRVSRERIDDWGISETADGIVQSATAALED